ncbi:MAG: glycosyltransferase family 4 protein [Owenweeksia sp.]|nr:glycosyltransferase family 4 protein [Owenweeksia sp.]
MGHLASFDWLPNQQGAQWFLDEVWPLVLKKQPDAHFKIAGRNMPDSIKNNTQPGVEVLPDVEDMRSFICGCRMVVVPLLAGSGMRIKVLENMALGACQISTSIGAEGYDAEKWSRYFVGRYPRGNGP